MSDYVEREMDYAELPGTEAKDIRACVGMYPWRAFAFVAKGSCPIEREYCFEMARDSNRTNEVCPYFCEVEAIDWLVAVKCDHPQAEASYG